MTFPQAIQSGFKNYVNFQGRATRSEYWWFNLLYWIIIIIPYSLNMSATLAGHASIWGLVVGVIGLAFFLPLLGLGFRRLHDTDRSAWWLLIALIPIIGGIVLLVFFCLPGTMGPNKYGSTTLQAIANTFS